LRNDLRNGMEAFATSDRGIIQACRTGGRDARDAECAIIQRRKGQA
jgi:hypothetical protein